MFIAWVKTENKKQNTKATFFIVENLKDNYFIKIQYAKLNNCKVDSLLESVVYKQSSIHNVYF